MTIIRDFEGTNFSGEPICEMPKEYRNSTFNIVSKVGYLIGVPRKNYDSDYWGLYSQMKLVRYCVMVESCKFGTDNRNALLEAGIPFSYMDDFCTGNSNKIKIDAMLRQVKKSLEEALKLNVNDMLRDAYRATRAEMSEAERKQFYDRYIKNMRLSIDANGNAPIALAQ